MKLRNEQYDFLKWFALIALPAFNIFILTVGKIWNLPYYVQIAATVSAVGVLIAALLRDSGKQYWSDIEAPQDTFNEDAEPEGEDIEPYEGGEDDENADEPTEE